MSQFQGNEPAPAKSTGSAVSGDDQHPKKPRPQFKIDNMPTPRIYMNKEEGKPGSSILVKDDTGDSVQKHHSGSSSSLLEAGKEVQHKKTPSVHAHFLEGEEAAGLRSRSGSGSDKALDAEIHPRAAFSRENSDLKKVLAPLASSASAVAGGGGAAAAPGATGSAAAPGSASTIAGLDRSRSPEKKIPASSSASGSASAGTSSTAAVGDPRLPQDDGKIHILLGATGSISTGKLREIIVKFNDIYGKDKVSIQIILTKAAEHFVSRGEIPSSVRIWRDSDEWSTWRSRTDPVVHIELRRWADILVICPLSANTLGKIALGLCDNLLTNVVRAWNTQYPVLIAPAMLSYAYNHPATKRHLKVINEDMKWIEVLKPVEKVVGSYGDIGMGGMMDWIQIVDKVVMKLGGYPEDEEEEDEDEGENNDEGDDSEEDEDDSETPANPELTSETAVEDDDDDDLGVQGLSLAEQENYEKTHKKLRSSKSFS